MYEFVDTDEMYTKTILPAEAMSYNGVFIENEIPGYRTLYVSGRELMESEVQDETINLLDGTNYLGKRYPPRTITVTYQLIASTCLEFRDSFNKLNRLLKDEQVKIIFNDEPDKYFIGTKIGNSIPGPGSNSITGNIEIYCSDPFKYSDVLKEFIAEPNDNGVLEVTVINDGSVSVPIDYEITHNAESGFIGVVSDKGTMQFGKIDEADKEPYEQNERLGTLWDFINLPNDTNGTDYMHPSHSVKGTLGTSTWFDQTFLTLGVSGPISSSSNGGLRTLILPSDSEGRKGAKNFYSYFHLIFYAGLMGQTGEMCINWLTEDNKLIAGVCWYKTDTTGNTGNYELWANGKVLHTYSYTTSHLGNQNPWYWDWGHCDLRKEGNRLTFYYWGGYPSYIIPEVENMECAKIQIAIKQYGNRGGSSFMTYMGVNDFVFDKMNVEKWKDIPNRYQPNDVCVIDGESSKFYVNGMYRPNDEILGSQYFKADSGETKIQFVVSEWTKTKPTVKVRVREAWI